MTTSPPLDNPTWGFIEWAITALSGAILTVVGYIMRTNGKLSTHTTLINHQSDLLDVVVDDVKQIKDKLAIRPTHEDISKLIFNMQTILEARLDQVSNRLSRIDERIDSILTRKN